MNSQFSKGLLAGACVLSLALVSSNAFADKKLCQGTQRTLTKTNNAITATNRALKSKLKAYNSLESQQARTLSSNNKQIETLGLQVDKLMASFMDVLGLTFVPGTKAAVVCRAGKLPNTTQCELDDLDPVTNADAGSLRVLVSIYDTGSYQFKIDSVFSSATYGTTTTPNTEYINNALDTLVGPVPAIDPVNDKNGNIRHSIGQQRIKMLTRINSIASRFKQLLTGSGASVMKKRAAIYTRYQKLGAKRLADFKKPYKSLYGYDLPATKITTDPITGVHTIDTDPDSASITAGSLMGRKSALETTLQTCMGS